ncbi:MAG: nitrogenase component 1 [Bilifractor sp.]
MKGLMKYMAPLAPDISGAVSVLFDAGGLIVIMDAGGCTGNACGFDEPRWFSKKSAIFSAGLRDLDAILGRDRLMLDKAGEVLDRMQANFLALIGTPVPSVIGTDFQGLRRDAEKRFGIPAIAIDTNGMDLYDRGEEKAYREVIRLIGRSKAESSERKESRADGSGKGKEIVLVFGCTPLNLAPGDTMETVRQRIREECAGKGDPEVIFCGEHFEDIPKIPRAGRSFVIAPSGLPPAREIEKRFGIPAETGYPVSAETPEELKKLLENRSGDGREDPLRILIVHQAVYASSLREKIREKAPGAIVDDASFFQLPEEVSEERDVRLADEDGFLNLLEERHYDLVLADPILKRAVRNRCGGFFSLPHFAVSGNLAVI